MIIFLKNEEAWRGRISEMRTLRNGKTFYFVEDAVYDNGKVKSFDVEGKDIIRGSGPVNFFVKMASSNSERNPFLAEYYSELVKRSTPVPYRHRPLLRRIADCQIQYLE
jgi:hypothetical protein